MPVTGPPEGVETTPAPGDPARRPGSGSPKAHVAVIAANGNVLAVNEAWLRFARQNGNPPLAKIGVGANYFAVCRRAAAQRDGFAAAALNGLLDVVRRKRKDFVLDYPCHAPHRPSWYRMTVTRHPGGRDLIVAHTLIEPTSGIRARARVATVSTR